MKKFLVLFLLSPSISLLFSQHIVQADKENIVSSRLEGEWKPHQALTERLTNKELTKEKLQQNISFKSDPSIAQKIPAKYNSYLAPKQIFMAGIFSYRNRSFPFVLVAHHGNPYVLFFQERNGDPMGDSESFNLILSPAEKKEKDLLFIGGDFNNQPFIAFERLTTTNQELISKEKANIDRTDAKATAKAILTAYQTKDFTTLKTLSSKLNQQIFEELAQQKENHPRYNSITKGWRWEAIQNWDGTIKGLYYHQKSPEPKARVKFAEATEKRTPVVTLITENGQWCFDDINLVEESLFSTTQKPAETNNAAESSSKPIEEVKQTIQKMIQLLEEKQIKELFTHHIDPELVQMIVKENRLDELLQQFVLANKDLFLLKKLKETLNQSPKLSSNQQEVSYDLLEEGVPTKMRFKKINEQWYLVNNKE